MRRIRSRLGGAVAALALFSGGFFLIAGPRRQRRVRFG
jgi:hypothetical protein